MIKKLTVPMSYKNPVIKVPIIVNRLKETSSYCQIINIILRKNENVINHEINANSKL